MCIETATETKTPAAPAVERRFQLRNRSGNNITYMCVDKYTNAAINYGNGPQHDTSWHGTAVTTEQAAEALLAKVKIQFSYEAERGEMHIVEVFPPAPKEREVMRLCYTPPTPSPSPWTVKKS